ncbi:hypothetical protein J588_2816 [Acinetobacter sp. 1578804]|nr:hypothetical protein J588_2816 [Acinetobacter sp. 1578804]EYT45720.1 hypothetical protein J619_01883 [Acinetobacter sp. 478810]
MRLTFRLTWHTDLESTAKRYKDDSKQKRLKPHVLDKKTPKLKFGCLNFFD